MLTYHESHYKIQTYNITAMTTLILLLGFSSWLAFDKGLCNNPYSSHHNVWTYTFQSKKYEEEHRTKEEDPTLLATQYVKLSYFGYPNINLPSVIVSQQLTAFLKSLTDTEYETAIKPILTEAAIRAPNTCLYDEWCDDQLNEYIASEDFIIAVKEILNEIISLTPLSTYLDILLQEQKYLWYKMYWSLDTSIDNPPIITYDKFNPIYRMCFCGVPFDIVVKVSNSMDDMLNSGYNETGLSYLYSLAPSWLDCIDHEYKISVLILENNRDKWANNFLYNLTTYIKAKTMMEYLLFDIQHIDYELTTPHKLKRILHYGEEEWLFKPMIYSLYLPTFLKPYIKYMTALLSDRHDVITSPNLANLTLETTIFGETVPFNNTTDNTARSFISYTNSFAITANDNKKNSSKLLDFVKYITKTVVRGYVVVHYPIFGMMYNSYTFIDSVYNMIYHKEEDNHKKRSQYTLLSLTDANEPPHYSLDPWLLACKKAPFNVTKHGYHAVAPHKGNHNLRNNYDIKYLRKIAPKKKNTIELLQKIKLPLSPHPLGIDLNLLNTECKKFVGSLAIQSDSPMANYLAKIIELYKVLRRIRPYDFYSEETELVLFIKANYNL